MRRRTFAALAALSLVSAMAPAIQALAVVPAFSNTLLLGHWTPPSNITTQPNANSSGDSEPAIAIGGPNHTLVVDGLAWLPFQVNMWKGNFGSTPATFGAMDTLVATKGNGRIGLGSGDADVEVTSVGTILLADLDFIVNKPFTGFTLGVSVTRCPAGAAGPSNCSTTLLDQAGADRPWITVNGTSAWLSYHDSGSSSLIHVWRSTDDGRSWHRVTSPIVGQGSTTGSATFNNIQGPLVADSFTGNVYDIFAAGQASMQKGTSGNFNNIIVSRSTNGGLTWTAHLVFHAPLFTSLNNIFPALAVDPTNGHLHAAWSDQHHIWLSTSADEGTTWSAPVNVSNAQTVVMPWVAARGGKLDVVYYGSSAVSVDDASAVWNVYDSQTTGSGWNVLTVSNSPNRVGAVCLGGSSCSADRQLLDLFEVVEDPVSGKAAVIYTDSTIDTYTIDGVVHQLPEIILAYEQ